MSALSSRLSLVLLVLPSLTAAAEPVDLDAIHRIRVEATEGSQVMDHLYFLTDVHGPRLTGSPGYAAAAGWTVERLRSWGVDSARLESWGRFGRGWVLRRYAARMTAPAVAALPGVPLAWTAGTPGRVSGEVVAAPLLQRWEQDRREDPEALRARIRAWIERHRGTLAGRIVLIDGPRRLEPPTEPASLRFDAERLARLAQAPDPERRLDAAFPIEKLPEDPEERRQLLGSLSQELEMDYWMRIVHVRDELNAFLRDEGVLAVFGADGRGDGGIVFAEDGGSWEVDAPEPPPIVALEPEAYGRLWRLVDRGQSVTVELEVDAELLGPVEGRNVIAEIPGGARSDEVVMLGGHLDSWHGGTGAADNAAGCAVALEAMRILKALDLPLARTVRLGLWDGEEQGYFGSRAWVRAHLGDPVSLELKPAHALFAGYFNLDNGSGRIRGVYLQGNDMARPIFEAWLAPFRDLGATTVSIRDTGGTDHLSFDAVGLPGFQFVQDPLDYGTRTHHSNLDVYDHAVSADLMQASAIVASFVYLAANREEPLPRKPLPEPVRGTEGAVLAGRP